MKPKKMLRWVVLASVGTLLAACGGGVTTLGSGDDGGMEKGGSSSMSTGGTTSGMVAGKGGSVGTAGKTSGVAGAGAMPGSELCMADTDCSDYGAPCEPCADGSYACNRTYCAGGKCVHARDQCNVKCSTDMDCPVRDVACKDCGDGTKACETAQCVMGFCQTSYPGCGGFDPCSGVGCGAPCKDCGPDGMGCSDTLAYCDATGKCTPSIPQCMDPGICMTAMDCGTPPPDCKPCGGGTCAQFQCLENKCVFGCLPDPEPQCETSEDCPIIGDMCTTCPATMKCAVQACLQGSCELVCPVD